jgi:hypothetical protein
MADDDKGERGEMKTPKKKRARIDDASIETIANSELKACVSLLGGDIADEREEALKYYNGEPLGDEVAGRSQVVSRDVLDTVEWMLPGLMRIFMSGDNVVEFLPQGPEDEASAEQATDYANYIFTRDNNGFIVLYDAFKDALLQKVGVIKVWWEESERTEVSTYSGLDEMAFLALVGEDDVSVDAHTLETDDLGIVTHDVTIRREISDGRVKIAAIPPEEFMISSRSATIADARFVGHKRQMSRSDLIEMGFDREVIEALGDSRDDVTGERETRFDDEEFDSDAAMDESQRGIAYVEGYLRADVNDDGISELIKVCLAGSGEYKLLDWEEVDDTPFADLCPVRTPHKFYGMSIADLVMDVQKIKTTLLRQVLDNLYLSNAPMSEVDISKVVNMDDFLTVRPGGIRRVKMIGASREIAVPFTAGASFPVLEYMDRIKETRTGSQPGAIADSEALQNQSATAVNMAGNASAQRVELIARLFAETGVRELFSKILHLVIKHQDASRLIRLRGGWVPIDPRGWNAAMDCQINVGLGHGSRDQQMGAIGQILSLQEKVLAAGGGGGMVTPKHIYATLERLVNLAGFKNAAQFFADPGDAPFPAPSQQADPNQGLVQAEMVKAQASIETARMRNETDMSLGTAKIENDMALKAIEIESRMRLEAAKLAAGDQAQKFDAASEVILTELKSRLSKQESAHSELVKQLGSMASPGSQIGF